MRAILVRLARFGLVGLTTTAVSYLIFRLGLSLQLHYLVASTLSWLAGLTLSYPLNRRFTFAAKGSASLAEAMRFALGGLLQYSVGQILYILTLGLLHLDVTVSFVFNVGVGCVVNFCYMRWVVFTPSPPIISEQPA